MLIRKIILVLFIYCFSCFLSNSSIAQEKVDKSKDKKATQKELSEAAKIAILVKTGKYAEAKDKIENLLKQDKVAEKDEILCLKGEIAFIEGNFVEAVMMSKEGFQLNSKNTRCFYNLITTLLYRGKYEDVEKIITDYEKIFPNQSNLILAKSLFYYETGELDKFEKLSGEIKKLIKNYKKLNSEELTMLAQVFYHLYERTGDLEIFNKIIHLEGYPQLSEKYVDLIDIAAKKDKYNIEPYLLCAEIAVEKKNRAIARDCLEKAGKINKNYPKFMFLQAMFSMPNMEVTMNIIEEILKINPNYIDALLFKANEFMNGESFDKVNAMIDKALSVNRKSIEANALKIAILAYQLKNKEIDEYISNLKLNKYLLARIYYNIGYFLSYRARWPEGQVWLKKAIDIDPELFEAQTLYALNLTRLGKEMEGKEILEEVYKKDPFNFEVYNVLMLLDKIEKKFTTTKSMNSNFIIKLHKKESEPDDDILLLPYLDEFIEKTLTELTKRYKYNLKLPIVLEGLTIPDDIGVRVIGKTIHGILGACFGEFITFLTSSAYEHLGYRHIWSATARHELAHSFALEISNFRVPLWFTEGLSTYEERLANPMWNRLRMHLLYLAYKGGMLPSISQLASGNFRTTDQVLQWYEYGSLIIEFLDKNYGFDKIVELLKLWGQGLTTSEAFEKALNQKLTEIDDKLKEFLENIFSPLKFYAPERVNPMMVEMALEFLQEGEKSRVKFDSKVLAQVALYLESQDKLDEAKKVALKALEINPNEGLAMFALGRIFLKLKRYEKATEYLEEAIKHKFDNFQIRVTLGNVYEELNKIDLAINEFNKAIEYFPYVQGKKDNPYIKIANLYEKVGEKEKRIEAIEKYLSVCENITDIDSALEVANYYFNKGDFDKAFFYALQAVYIEPKVVEPHYLLARIFIRKKEWQRAITELNLTDKLLSHVENKEAKLFTKSRAKVKCKLAEILYHKTNQKKRALSIEKEAIKLSPDIGGCIKKNQE